MRLDAYLARHHPEHSRATWQKLIRRGTIQVNGQLANEVDIAIADDDTVTVTPLDIKADKRSLPIIYQDDDVMVIDKPAAVLTHAKGELYEEFTLADFVRPYTTYHHDTNRPGVIHRLDRVTSGVILLAKHEPAAHMLIRQFQRRTVQKTYYAVVNGVPKDPEALIDVPIGRNPRRPSTFRADVMGKSAQTAYRVIERNEDQALLKLQPKTGRTHQLRVHLAHIGCPIVGDSVYGTAADRMYLHAASLELTLPDGNHHTFHSPVPESFHVQKANS